MGAILVVWWLISNIVALLVNNDLIGGILLAAFLCLPYFGMILFPGLHLALPFCLSTFTLSIVIWQGLKVAAAMADKPAPRASMKEKLEAYKIKAVGGEKTEKHREKGKEMVTFHGTM